MADTVSEIVGSMTSADVYSALLSFLYDLKDIPEYTLLSELCYLIKDVDSFLNVITYFSGQTVKFPTEQELSEAIQVLKLYQFHEIEGRPWKDAIKLAGFDTCSGKLAKNKLEKLKKTINKYNFNNRSY